MSIVQTAERNSETIDNNVMTHRHLIAYESVAGIVSGKLLEVGCGVGYGLRMMAPVCDEYTGIDKFDTHIDEEMKEKYSIDFRKMEVPPFTGINDDEFDYVVCFQVVEHIKNDDKFIQEIKRVIKPGGKLIMSTPNIKMSLTRNPWHVREYTINQFDELIGKHFDSHEMKGVYGNEKVMEYYEENKKSVRKITRFDFLNLQYNLPRWIIKIPYDIFNKISRSQLSKQNENLVSDIRTSDFFVKEADNNCFDFFAIATKSP